jgi:hypothetical protein
MRIVWSCAALAALCLSAPARGAAGKDAPRAVPEAGKAKARSYEVPYRLTIPKHVLVRAKINGKGPFNFILDTGAPALFVAVPVCEKLGIKPDRNGWGTFDRFEIEGGVVLTKARGRVETPSQLEGMNGMGLAGAEVHGMIGYNILAQYRMTIDFTRDKMTWTPLDYKPVAPSGMGARAGGGAGGLEVMGSILKMLGGFLGRKASPDVIIPGFLGITLVDGGESPTVRAVLENGPAGKAGLRVGDRVTKFRGRTVTNTEDVLRFAHKVRPGEPVTLTVLRGKDTRVLEFLMGEGF